MRIVFKLTSFVGLAWLTFPLILNAQGSCAASDYPNIKFSQSAYSFQIKDTTMPKVEVSLEGSPECLKELQSKVNWHVIVEYWDGGIVGQHLIDAAKLGAQREGKRTGDFWEFSAKAGPKLSFTTSQLGGGSGQITAKFTDAGQEYALTADLTVTAQDYIPRKLILDQFKTLPLQVIGFMETRFTHFHLGQPLLNCGNSDCTVSDGGFGLTQITNCPGTVGSLTSIPTKTGNNHGYPSLLQIWNWKSNVDAGISCLAAKQQARCVTQAVGSDDWWRCGYQGYNGSAAYANRGMGILTEAKQGIYRKGWFGIHTH